MLLFGGPRFADAPGQQALIHRTAVWALACIGCVLRRATDTSTHTDAHGPLCRPRSHAAAPPTAGPLGRAGTNPVSVAPRKGRRYPRPGLSSDTGLGCAACVRGCVAGRDYQGGTLACWRRECLQRPAQWCASLSVLPWPPPPGDKALPISKMSVASGVLDGLGFVLDTWQWNRE